MARLVRDQDKLEALIVEARQSGGAERANYQLFVERLCVALDLPKPEMAREENKFNDYVFERSVAFKHPDGTTTSGFIDCYKKSCFILEAKQSRKRNKQRTSLEHFSLLPEDEQQFKSGHALRGSRGWDQVMLAARKQAEDYARALPIEHGYPPFLLVVDVGHVIEIYADFSGQGKYYAHFPDRQSYRITMEDLRRDEIKARLSAVWTNPESLDPTRVSAEVTRDIADRLARIAKILERKYDPKDVAEFLMRCLFTMFAEDVGLIPEKGFYKLLGRLKEKPENFVPAVESLWKVMDEGGYAPHLDATLKRFNGSLFKDCRALELDRDAISELYVASGRDWSQVEPAIFGTLLERALDSRERSKLGAHYTPRAYVERLVVPTIIEPLKTDWELVQGQVKELRDKGNREAALAAVKAFHHILCTTRVLDPACGTGNFLYVSLELMKRLEGEVLEALDDLGEDQARFVMEGETVSPRQFYGLELNARAVPIADLVLWIGYLKWQLKTGSIGSISEPILHAYGTIRQQDALIAYDKRERVFDSAGKSMSRWDGVTKRQHPVTGEEVPDHDAQVMLFRYIKPRRAPWPETEFIVGNPPFVAGKDMRNELGEGYAEACWKARPSVPGGADFVLHFWDEAATRLLAKPQKGRANPLRRFGFITTNSITQTFSRRVLERYMIAKEPLSLVFAIADHPWLKAADKAAVRISMTVAALGEHGGVLAEVIGEQELNTDTPRVTLDTKEGKIRSSLTIGADVSLAKPLIGNAYMGHKGMMPYGTGFWIDATKASQLVKEGSINHPHRIKPYLNGADLTRRPRGIFAIDFLGLTQEQAREYYPRAYAHLYEYVRPGREANNRKVRRDRWWLFAEPALDLREAISSLTKYIATTETAKHRTFSFVESTNLADQKLRVISSDKSEILAILSSRLHILFAMAKGGWQGIGNDPVYQHTQTFDPFPFPIAADPNLKSIDKAFAQQERLRELGNRLDSFRSKRLAEHRFLTITGMYNALERLREVEHGVGEPLSDEERDIHQAGLISVLQEIHDDIDRAVFSAYGWDDMIPLLVGAVGATIPSSIKGSDQLVAEEEVLTRLVKLNQERALEEKSGHAHWLRPDFQKLKLGSKAPNASQEDVGELDLQLSEFAAERPKWPKDGLEQIKLVRDVLAKASAPALSGDIAAAFDGRGSSQRRDRITQVLQTLVATGVAQMDDLSGQSRYFLPR